MRHQYSDATTRRYMEWLAQRSVGQHEPPRLAEIERWLEDDESYRSPMEALRNLCVGLREQGCTSALQWIASTLISELQDERSFSAKADAFFSAAISRVGVEDYDVRVFNKNSRFIGTLHDMQLEREATT